MEHIVRWYKFEPRGVDSVSVVRLSRVPADTCVCCACKTQHGEQTQRGVMRTYLEFKQVSNSMSLRFGSRRSVTVLSPHSFACDELRGIGVADVLRRRTNRLLHSVLFLV